jgi:predicted metallopeptidase
MYNTIFMCDIYLYVNYASQEGAVAYIFAMHEALTFQEAHFD